MLQMSENIVNIAQYRTTVASIFQVLHLMITKVFLTFLCSLILLQTKICSLTLLKKPRPKRVEIIAQVSEN